MNIAVLASGKGSNFEAIARAVKSGYLKADLKLLVTDNQNAFVRIRAKRLNIKEVFVDPRPYKSRLTYDKKIVEFLRKEKIDIVALAGYMRVLSPYFVKSFSHKIINIHPALLPSFKGTQAIERAFKYGCKVTGVTVHIVDESVDHGPIIVQEAIEIKPAMTLAKLEEKIHALEHKLYPLALKLMVEKKIRIRGRCVETA